MVLSSHIYLLSALQPFGGSGQRLDGKKKKVPGKGKTSSSTDAGAVSQATYRRGIPHYDYKVGKLKFFSAKSLEAMVKKREDEKKAEVGPEKHAPCIYPCLSVNVKCVCVLSSSVVRVHTI